MNRHIISSDAPLIEAISMLNTLSGSVMTIFTTDADGRLEGSLTDGDVRRALLRGVSPTDPVSMAVNRKFRFIGSNDTDCVATLRDLRESGVKLIPRLDADGRITEIIDTTLTPTRLPLQAILMAGGRGERLRPLTLTTPKPLLKIGNRSIIDYNIEALERCGITDITVTVNYLAEQIERHFAQKETGVAVRCVREDRPLGTIGSASLVEIPEKGNTLVMNSDLLTNISFEEMYVSHRDTRADITIAAIPYKVSVPYAILATEGNRVNGLQEKPSYTYYANAGIYIISNRLLRRLDSETRTDATDLIEQAIAEGLNVSYFPISGTWIDIGSPADFNRASELMAHLNTSRL